MMHKIKILLYIIICSYSGIICGQVKIEDYLNNLKEAKTNTEKADLYSKTGNLYFKASSYDSALYYFNSALKITDNTLSAKKIAESINYTGVEFGISGIFDKAIKCFVKALRVFEKINDKNGMADCYMHIGNVLSQQPDYPKALEFYFKSLKLKTEIGDKKGIMGCYLNIGVIHTYQKKFEKAIEDFTISLNIAKETGDKNGMAMFYNNIGSAISEQGATITDKETASGKFKSANEYFMNALTLYRINKDINGEAVLLNDIALVHARQNNFSTAIKYADSSLKLAKRIGALTVQRDVYQNLATIYSKINNYKEAFNNYILFKQTADSIFNLQKSRQIDELQLRYETEKREKEISNQNIRIDLLEKEKKIEKFKRFGLISFIIMLVAISIIIVLYLKKKIRSDKQIYDHKTKYIEAQKLLADTELSNQKLQSLQLQNELKYKNKELEYKNNEIINLGLHISERDDFLRKIKLELTRPNSNFDRKTVIKFIDQNLMALEKERKEFEAYVENISQSFFIKLRQKIPDITKTEERLAVLLKLNLTSKEISTIFNINIRSVEMSRYRLRKKLELGKDEHLADFLNNI